MWLSVGVHPQFFVSYLQYHGSTIWILSIDAVQCGSTSLTRGAANPVFVVVVVYTFMFGYNSFIQNQSNQYMYAGCIKFVGDSYNLWIYEVHQRREKCLPVLMGVFLYSSSSNRIIRKEHEQNTKYLFVNWKVIECEMRNGCAIYVKRALREKKEDREPHTNIHLYMYINCYEIEILFTFRLTIDERWMSSKTTYSFLFVHLCSAL